MMENNIAMTRLFQEGTMSDNRSTFRLSSGICITGLVLMGAVVALTAMGRIESGVALVTGIAGAITELGSGISLVMHQRASEQTSRYFDALHENEQTLYAMNMVLQISDDELRDRTLSETATGLVKGVANRRKQEKGLRTAE